MSTPAKPKIIAVVGPTATGKSALAVHLAKHFNGEVISADSRQVYKGLNLGSGKITHQEMQGVPHHLLDSADPAQQFSVAEYKEQAEKAITDILMRGRLPILCGGTGLYVQAVADNMVLPEVPPNPELRKVLEVMPTDELFARLETLDPDRALSIDPNNPRRLVRAIEIVEALGKVPPMKSEPRFEALFIGLTRPDNELREAIQKRLDERLRLGMIDEAKRLLKKGVSLERMEDLGLEYRYLAKHLRGELSEDEMREQLLFKIRQYAKRQLTWWKRETRVKWFTSLKDVEIDSSVLSFLMQQ